MISKRPIILMGILLVMVFLYIFKSSWEPYVYGDSSHTIAPPLSGKNTISGLAVQQGKNGQWIATFDYFYTGEPQAAYLSLKLPREINTDGKPTTTEPSFGGFISILKRGKHHVSVEIQRPPMPDTLVTRQVVVQMRLGTEQVIASQSIAQRIDWPDWQTWALDRELMGKTTDELYKRAVALIDNGSQHELDQAKRILERLIERDAEFDAGYVELARIAMKINWGPEGLRQAESLLESALRIRPDSVNAKILLGYVYSHQKRFKESESLFAEASQTDTKNLWLWANWGELLAMQGKFDQSEVKYREAVTRPQTHDTYDRARLYSYVHLLALLERRKDFDGMEALHKQRTEEFGGKCFRIEYARFMLQQRGDTSSAINLARQSMNANCDMPAREVLGLAHYVIWADSSNAHPGSSLDQARVFLPASARLLYLLAMSDHTVKAAKRLLATGESIEQLDNAKLNALAYALERKDLMAVRRLIKLGARVDAPVGFDSMPVALLPVMAIDIETIHLMQNLGVDYSKIRHRGITAMDYAKQIGDKRLISALNKGGQKI